MKRASISRIRVTPAEMFLWIESSGKTRSLNLSPDILLLDGSYLKLRDIISFVQGDIYWILMLTVSQTLVEVSICEDIVEVR